MPRTLFTFPFSYPLSMSTRDISARIAEATLAAEGLITVKLYREDPAIYFARRWAIR